MKAPIVLGIAALLLLAISLVRIGGIVEYKEDGLTVWIRAGALHFRIFPIHLPKKKRQKLKKIVGQEKKSKKKKKGEASTVQSGVGASLPLLKKGLSLAAEAAGRLKRKLQIDMLYLDFTAGAADSAMAAMEFGYVNLAASMICPLLEHNFNVKDRRIRTKVDFQRTSPAVFLRVSLSLTVGQGVSLGIWFLIQFLKLLVWRRSERRITA